MNIEEIIINLSYFGILLLMSGTGFFGIFPPSKIIYGLGGYFAFQGNLNIYYLIFWGALGHTIGNYIQYELARQKGIKYILKFKFFPEKEIKKVQIVFKKKGLIFLFLGKLLDPIKLIICICAGISKTPRILFFPIVFITSLIWASIFSYIGFYFGKSFENFGIIGIIIFILALIVMSFFYKYMNSKEIEEELKIIEENKKTEKTEKENKILVENQINKNKKNLKKKI